MSRIGQSLETEGRLVVARAAGKRSLAVTVNMHKVSFQGDGNDLDLDRGGGGCTTLGMY